MFVFIMLIAHHQPYDLELCVPPPFHLCPFCAHAQVRPYRIGFAVFCIVLACVCVAFALNTWAANSWHNNVTPWFGGRVQFSMINMWLALGCVRRQTHGQMNPSYHSKVYVES